LLRGRRQLLRPHVVRRRIDEIAGKSCRFCHSRDGRNVDAVGRHQLDTRGIRLAIALEAITAERKRKRGKTGVVRRVGEAIDAGRQQARQRAGPEQVAGFAGVVLQAEHDLRDLAIRGGQRETRSGLGRKAIGQRELPGLRRKIGADCVPCRLGRKCDGNG
jgi:hypothetical protein